MKGVKLYSEIALVLGTWVIYCIVQIIDFLFERISFDIDAICWMYLYKYPALKYDG